MKDPFEAACEEQPESPAESPIPADEDGPLSTADGIDDDEEAEAVVRTPQPPPPPPQQQQQQQQHQPVAASGAAVAGGKGKEEDVEGEEEEENVNINVDNKVPSSADPDKMAKMQAILSQFTEEQMSRYESFRRSGFQKSNMRRGEPWRNGEVARVTLRVQKMELELENGVDESYFELLTSITGSQKISMPMTIVVSGIAKMFVGELVETGRTVMMERKETGPIRPCHIREAYRRLKLEGKIPRRSVPRLFR